MKTKITLLGIFFGLWLIVSCKKEDPEKEGPCGVKDPITELPWLKKTVEKYQTLPGYATNYSAAIGTIIHKGERVFWIYDANSSDGSALYRCDGTFFYLPTAANADEADRELRMLIGNPIPKMCPYLIWQTPNFKKLTCS